MTKPKSLTARIEVFRTGTFTPMQGEAISYSAADLKAMADVYDRETAPAPIVVGHPAIDAPAFGWAESFDYDASSDRLFANVGEITPEFAEAVRAGHYKKISLSFFRPDNAANPVPGSWYPKHIGFLGGAAPAVTGLKNVQFSAEAVESPVFSADFANPGFEQTASLFRMMRDFFIEKFGLDAADKVLPGYQIEWLNDTDYTMPARSSFSAPPETKTQEPTVKVEDPNFAAREADINAREERLRARERDITNADNVAFAEGLVKDGKLIAASKDQVVAVLNALPAETAVSFAAGEAAVPVSKAIRDILSAQPKVVSFGRQDLPEPGNESTTASFASDGRPVDADKLVIHQKAVEYQRNKPGTDYITAVKAVS